MKKEIRALLLAAVLSILFCVGVFATDYTTKAGSQRLHGTDSVPASVKVQADQMAAVSAAQEKIEVEGTVTETLPNATFNVELKDGKQIRCYLSDKLRQNFIRIRVDDRVIVEMNPSDQEKGRIIWRYKN